jgi:hypothetical protein
MQGREFPSLHYKKNVNPPRADIRVLQIQALRHRDQGAFLSRKENFSYLLNILG